MTEQTVSFMLEGTYSLIQSPMFTDSYHWNEYHCPIGSYQYSELWLLLGNIHTEEIFFVSFQDWNAEVEDAAVA